ncbi:related to beta-1,3-glucan binding protein [Melanopsichium pennsylvanicum]|uniref:Related to beta-1,3-glucan binding protein n=2 Tax=Melanopsichium pennsylvanicum TaxID=63383 RepID=A0AAJ4XMJ8_9BASI|nr:related to beta-1,3-glucan binding protein [Melanopsichium pennsylvanicum 4]SNX84536.1 related to beta-1,3-glucan binding protein [Melanopsichium pennsylvanicum]
MVGKARKPMTSTLNIHDINSEADHKGAEDHLEHVHEMPSINSVISQASQDGCDLTPPLSPSHSISARACANTSVRKTKTRPPPLAQVGLASSSTRSWSYGVASPRTPVSNYLEAERNRFYNSYPSIPTTPYSLYSKRASTPEAGMYQASINTSLTNVALKRRKPSSARRGPIIQIQEKPEKPWLQDKKRQRMHQYAKWTFLAAAATGVVGAVLLMYFSWAAVPRDKYCLVLEEHFDGPELDKSIWFHEQETGGYGNNQFEWTTDSTNNTFVEDGHLYIVPTLTADHVGDEAVLNGYTLNLTESGLCTAKVKTNSSCAVISNSTTGVILPPVQSARIMTNLSRTIKYGRVEVRARMPTGDWLWPAIWMLPKDSVYGDWPRSGEIDIVETKGNKPRFRGDDASNNMHSTLHFGPVWLFDGFGFATKIRKLWHKYYNEEFHTFGLEWTEDKIFTWERSPVWRNMQVDMKPGGFWKLGRFPQSMTNGTLLDDPWAGRPDPYARSAPFDQEFYLIMNVAVGGTNGFFKDSQGDNKPWSNDAENARAQFWTSRNQWLPTWPEDPRQRGMAIDYVKMWQKCS